MKQTFLAVGVTLLASCGSKSQTNPQKVPTQSIPESTVGAAEATIASEGTPQAQIDSKIGQELNIGTGAGDKDLIQDPVKLKRLIKNESCSINWMKALQNNSPVNKEFNVDVKYFDDHSREFKVFYKLNSMTEPLIDNESSFMQFTGNEVPSETFSILPAMSPAAEVKLFKPHPDLITYRYNLEFNYSSGTIPKLYSESPDGLTGTLQPLPYFECKEIGI